jgi:hypothetical protein
MFTHDAPPKTAVLNSLADDPSTGDERNFLSLRTPATAVGRRTEFLPLALEADTRRRSTFTTTLFRLVK